MIPTMKKVTPKARREPEAIKELLEVEVSLVLAVRNGAGGRPITRWAVINRQEITVAAMKVASEPILLQAAQGCIPQTVEGFIKGHGAAVVNSLRQVQERAAVDGIVQVIVSAPPVGDEEPSRIVLAKV